MTVGWGAVGADNWPVTPASGVLLTTLADLLTALEPLTV